MKTPVTTVYDISLTLGEENINFPGDTEFSRKSILDLRMNGVCNLSKIVMSSHAGTHIDLPLHFISGKKTMEQYSPKDFILPAIVCVVDDKQMVRKHHVEDLDIRPGDALLFKTDNSMSGRCRSGSLSEHFVEMSLEVADFCVEKKVALVGIDYNSVEKSGDDSYPIHHCLMENNIIILESINLIDVPQGRYTLICLPLKIKDAEASPVRAVLVE